MRYVWSNHAVRDRLPERTSLTAVEIEQMLSLNKRVIKREYYGSVRHHHLLWDAKNSCLVDIPLIVSPDGAVALIPTVLPVTYGSGYEEWQRADAEHTWRGVDYWTTLPSSFGQVKDVAELILARLRQEPSGYWRYQDQCMMSSWGIFDQESAAIGGESLLALFRNQAFRLWARELLQAAQDHIKDSSILGIPVIHLKKAGAHRHIPLNFFSSI